MKGILADINIQGYVDVLIRQLQTDEWLIFWNELQLGYYHFDDVGLPRDATDQDIWLTCQADELVLLTDNRNQDGPHSLESVIRLLNTETSLPVLTISNTQQLRHSASYAIRVIEKLLDFLQRVDELRGTGRLYLP